MRVMRAAQIAKCEAELVGGAFLAVDGLTFEEWREAIDLALENEIETGVPITPFVVSGERFDALLISNRRIANDILTEGISFE
jgi:hypothetical protein